MFEDLTGKRFGKLTVICRAPNKVQPNGAKVTKWRCQCDCGTIKDVPAYNLKIGKTNSCGCIRVDAGKNNMTHGGTLNHKRERLYRVWATMLNRCYMPKFSSYKNYGARGITVCDEWKSDYAAFKKWAYENGYDENAPRGKCTIDRIDVNGSYCPENCRWTTWETQSNNKRNNVYITARGKTQTIAEWSRETGILPATINARINRLGWAPEKAVLTGLTKGGVK